MALFGVSGATMKVITLATATACVLCGCASTQLNFNTVDIASSLADLYTRQVLTNFSAYIDNPQTIPSQVDLSAGTIQTSNSVSPTVSAPLSRMSTWNGAGVVTGSTIAGAGLNASLSDGWQQNWNVSPVTDANTLRNLRAIYRYAVYGSDLLSEYHVPRTLADGKLVTDTYSLQLPQCIVCKPNGYKGPKYVNPKLKGGWLYWTSDAASAAPTRLLPDGVALVDLGRYGAHELFMTREDFQKGYLSNFTLFTLPNAEPSAGGGGAQTGAQAGGGRRNYTRQPPPPPPPPFILPPSQ